MIGNEIEFVSKELSKCTNLEKVFELTSPLFGLINCFSLKLNLSNNKLLELDVTSFSKLDELILSGNKFRRTPHGMGCLKFLTTLDISW